jgi:AAA+ ATPase superfamily predicted ATPase
LILKTLKSLIQNVLIQVVLVLKLELLQIYKIGSITLYKERVKYEIGLNKREYDKLKDKIDWDMLSANPSIFEAK